ncbi:GNAT family N-acetyltransferase [Halovenus sp. WSH3]|uniref:GNAT family N-acetyltransferase n=1 Tax=Halovenus carboxidivorans TaxID=2692199 RepID=A0A6B0SZL6_9EURY|nr:GNAT family N-acetyltransferase [Halovenus carboxidivorans]MXR51308.1 GNAT family N-acetyltransferase [Halovenus carboxidivorans]
MTALSIRWAEPTDTDALASVYRSAYAANRELGFPAKAETATADTVEGWLEGYELLVGTVDGQIVGGVRLETNEDHVKISRLAVHEERKGEGIGSRLLERAEEVAAERDHSAVRLTTPENHPFLPSFYRDRGYEQVGEYPLSYREYDEIVLEKSL